MSLAIESRFREVEKLVVAAQAKGLDPEVAAYYCKLGCVMICGAVERSVEILITERVGNRSAPQVNSFLKSFFKRGTNYHCEEILELLYKFDSSWGHKFKEFIAKNDQIKSGVLSCYAIRNSIAHGGTQSLGPNILKQYFENSFSLIAELEKLLRS
ncbi:HEPN domain-containing protein [Chelativorans xinjiangense]|uniref:HEPN domain-containing protein n=1 Tax=Chelativorans xinjiangense TaxID=2681485 RepID=UPI001358D698|nr:HEPN domain-containing protein [Chelativorans xinjiangense]